LCDADPCLASTLAGMSISFGYAVLRRILQLLVQHTRDEHAKYRSGQRCPRQGTFLSERYRRLVKRRGKGKALVAVARSILVIIWHQLADPTARFHDLGADFYDRRLNTTRKINNLVRQLEALGHTVTLQPAA
jgi:hypothetical protein